MPKSSTPELTVHRYLCQFLTDFQIFFNAEKRTKNYFQQNPNVGRYMQLVLGKWRLLHLILLKVSRQGHGQKGRHG